MAKKKAAKKVSFTTPGPPRPGKKKRSKKAKSDAGAAVSIPDVKAALILAIEAIEILEGKVAQLEANDRTVHRPPVSV